MGLACPEAAGGLTIIMDLTEQFTGRWDKVFVVLRLIGT